MHAGRQAGQGVHRPRRGDRPEADGRSIPDIFAAEGEDGFRARESAQTARFAKEGRQLLSCGGGIIKRGENLRALHQNGVVLFIDRPLDALTVGGGRPLSSSTEALKKMEAERRPLYLAAADAVMPEQRHGGGRRDRRNGGSG